MIMNDPGAGTSVCATKEYKTFGITRLGLMVTSEKVGMNLHCSLCFVPDFLALCKREKQVVSSSLGGGSLASCVALPSILLKVV